MSIIFIDADMRAVSQIFDDFLPESQLWVYIASARLTDVQTNELQNLSDDFVGSWKSHGTPVRARYSCIDNQVLLFAADANYLSPSGCSLDSLSGHIKNLGNRFGIDFFGRLSVLVWQPDHTLSNVPISAFKAGIQSGIYTPDTYIFDHSMHQCADLKSHTNIEAGHTWLKKFFAHQTDN